MRIRRAGEFEAELLAALARPEGTVIEVMLAPELFTTRGSMTALTQAILK